MAGEQTAQPIQQEQQTEQNTGGEQVQDYRKLYEESQSKVKEYEGKFSEANDAIANFENYFKVDTVAEQRARLWLQAQKEGKNPEELWKSLEKSAAPEKKTEAPVVDVDSIEKRLLEKLRPTLENLTQSQRAQAEQAAQLSLERDKAQLFKDEPWLTEELYKEYEGRFGKKVAEMRDRILSNQGPFLTQAQKSAAIERAGDQAIAMYAHLSERELLNLFMPDYRDKFIAEGRRAAPKMPEGMTTDLPTGKAPQLLDQLKRKYKAVEGTSKVKDLIQEYAPQLGLSEEKTYALVANE